MKRLIQNLKWGGIFAVTLTFALGRTVAEAQQPKNLPQIGFLLTNSQPESNRNAEIIRQGLRDLGYVEGSNIVIHYRSAEGKLDRLPDLAAELVRLKVDVIITSGDNGTRAAQKATN
jgi:putative ABC transport system substrate-binding protein